MAKDIEAPTTQRAYTLRLHGAHSKDNSWRDALWATHRAVNNGARVFGDWLLTFRGGLCHSLADAKVPQGKEKPGRDPAPEERRGRRVLLALSWLSVESAPRGGDPHSNFIVASGKDGSQSVRNEKVLAALRAILQARGVTGAELDAWIADCEQSVSAAIRDDAVWVNRSALFDAAQAQVGPSLTRGEVWDFLEPFFAGPEAYLAPINPPDSNDDTPVEDEKPKDLVQKAGHWLSLRGGQDEGADFPAIATRYADLAKAVEKVTPNGTGANLIRVLCHATGYSESSIENLFSAVSYTGSKRKGRFFTIVASLAEKSTVQPSDLSELSDAVAEAIARFSEATERRRSNPKGPRPYAEVILARVAAACGFPYAPANAASNHRLYGVMLDHAARRVSIAHTWIKRAESERRNFKTDAAKIDAIPVEARAWLDGFCQDRSTSSGSVDAYRIRRRAIGGWKEVIARWSSPRCNTSEDRVSAARGVQADPDIDKFGDVQLFEALAADNAFAVWRVNGEATPQPLIDYAIATEALAKQKRFKVPAYRHPDPLSHPVFCDFGNSRWEIRFAVHDAASKLNDAKAIISRREEAMEKAIERLARARTPEKQADARSRLKQAENELTEARSRVIWLQSRNAVSMGLWDGGRLGDDIPLRWSCKRLTNDLGLQRRSSCGNTTSVTRADRLGRAAAGMDRESPAAILGLFDQADWNGRLQAPRRQLNDIARHVQERGWDAKAKRLRDRIRWLVSFSAKLQPTGPWLDYLHGFSEDDPVKPFVSRKGEYAVKHLTNDGRSGQAKLALSRLPGLRVLSVDLGHRFAAACAAWEALSLPALTSEIAGRTVIAGGTGPDDMYLHTRHRDQNANERTTIYRRIGADTLPDGTPHPAPWTRLDRQFLIKLPGEEKPARAASKKGRVDETAMVAEIAADLGLARDKAHDNFRAVDELMDRAVRTMTLGLKRHARRAKIAYALDPSSKAIPGMGGSEKAFVSGDDAHIGFLTDALLDWHALASEPKWDDRPARDLWNQHIATMKNGWRIEEPKPQDETAEGPTRQQRRKEDDVLRERLKPVAEQLAATDRRIIHAIWRDRWQRDDGNCANPDAGQPARGLYAHLRRLTDWIMGRQLPGADKKESGWRQNVGGLSLTRIATMKSLYQLHKAFAMRARPDRPRGAPEKGESNAGVAQSILEAMERMRDQRVKQLASRIAGSALGLGGHWGRVDTKRLNADGSTRKKWIWVEEPTAKYPPCHAVVIENLTNYRPEETQTRRENRLLMSWSSSKVKKYLSEACQLHGLHLREVQAGYTSRQDSRTGAPGHRCADVPVVDFMTKPWWRREVRRAVEKGAKGDPREKYLVMLDNQCSGLSDSDRKTSPPIRIPVNGGGLFVSADARSPAAQGLQADLNAAANIGLRALMDPDFTGKWWFIPCESATYKPHTDKTKGSAVISASQSLGRAPGTDAPAVDTKPGNGRRRAKALGKEREIVYLWRDISASPIECDSRWRTTADYWNGVWCRVIALLCGAHARRIDKSVEAIATPW